MKVAIAMSGGVDSSVAALLIKEQGHEVVGVMLKMWDGTGCGSADDAEVAREICGKLGMEFHLIDVIEDFKSCVIERFVSDYENGRTPNPCVVCNKTMKFGRLLKEAERLGCEAVATGHYARIEKAGSRFLLKRGIDGEKDQSYMLYSLSQEQLSKTLLPLGALSKSEVREIAERNGLSNAQKKDSQDICFVPDGDYAGFIEQYTQRSFPEGDFVGRDGEIYGKHKGIIHYTIGQRKGLGLSFPQPMFVSEINTAKNTVKLVESSELFSKELLADEINLIAVERLENPLRVTAKIRYRHKAEPAVAEQQGSKLKLTFDEPQRAVTSGQSVVIYQDDVVVGGGVIVQ